MVDIIIPPKLIHGSHIRVIAPSNSLSIVSKTNRDFAKIRLEESGFRVSFSQNALELDENNSSSMQSRVEDLHVAFLDDDVDGIFTAIGGYNSHEILNLIDFSVIS